MTTAAVPLTRSRTRNVLWGAWLALALTGLQVVQGVLLMPLYLRHIPVERYGLWLATGNVIALVTIVDPSVGEIVRVKLAHALGAADTGAAEEAAGTALALSAVVSVVLLALGALVVAFVPALLGQGAAGDLQRALVACVVGTVLVIASYVLSDMLEAAQFQRESALVTLAAVALGIGATFLGLTRWGWGLLALGIAPLVRGAVSLAALAPLLARALRASGVRRLRLRRAQAADFVRTGILTTLSRIGYTAMQQSDALLVTVLVGPEATVVYALTARARDLLQTLPARTASATVPAIAHKLGSAAGDPRERAATSRAVLGVLAGSIAFGGALMAAYAATNAAFMQLWVGRAYSGGQPLTILLALAGIAVTLREAYMTALAGFGRLRTVAVQRLAEAAARTVLAVVLLRTLGLAGLAIATIAGAAALLPSSISRLGTASGVGRVPYARMAGYAAVLALVAAAAGVLLPRILGDRLAIPQFLLAGTAVAVLGLACNLTLSGEARGALAARIRRLRR